MELYKPTIIFQAVFVCPSCQHKSYWQFTTNTDNMGKTAKHQVKCFNCEIEHFVEIDWPIIELRIVSGEIPARPGPDGYTIPNDEDFGDMPEEGDFTC